MENVNHDKKKGNGKKVKFDLIRIRYKQTHPSGALSSENLSNLY